MLPYASSPSWGIDIAGSLGSLSVEKARKPSQRPAHVSLMARIRVGCASAIV